ncbi:mononuclear molybdenum enzyme YedY, partial [Bowmanella dokdonensis]|nr:mononuclear molybdenum enzyme YedY [Bowmanella dokdonensis]
DEAVYQQRRQILKQLGFMGAGALLAPHQSLALNLFGDDKPKFKTHPLSYSKQENHGETLTPFNKVSGHNNFYEFGTDKADPKANAQAFDIDPWLLRVDG